MPLEITSANGGSKATVKPDTGVQVYDISSKNGVRTYKPTTATKTAVVGDPKKYSLKLGGTEYQLSDREANWIRERYATEAATIDPKLISATYTATGVDSALKQSGLPSSKYILDYMSAYDEWYGDGTTYTFSKDAQKSIGDKFKSSWQYDYTVEDQRRKKLGLAPVKVAEKYKDSYADSQLLEMGLPPSSDLAKYVEDYDTVQNETAKKNYLYDLVTAKIMDKERELGGYAQLDDTARMAIFDEVYSSSEFDDIRHLFQKSPEAASTTNPTDTLEEYEAKWAAMGKKSAASDEPVVSWADFINGYQERKSSVITDKVAYDAAVSVQRKKTTAELSNKEEVQSYIDSRKNDDPVQIMGDMVGAGLSLSRLTNAKDYLLESATTEEEKKRIRSAFKETRAYYAGELAESASSFLSNIFSERSRAERKAVREENKADDTVLKTTVTEPYAQGTTSAITADEAESIFRSHLVYDDKGKITGESVKTATNMLYDAGASTSVVKEVGNRVGLPYNGIEVKNYTALMAFQYNVNQRDVQQRTELAEKVRSTIVSSGSMNDFEYDNALRREGWGDTISDEKLAADYYTYVEKPKYEANGEKLPNWDEVPMDALINGVQTKAEYIQLIKDNATYIPEIHKSDAEIVSSTLARTFIAGLAQVDATLVSFADKATIKISGRTDMWDTTKYLMGAANKLSYSGKTNQSFAAESAYAVSSAARELERMYALSELGSGVLSMFSAAGTALSATNTGVAVLSKLATATPAVTKGINAIVKGSKWAIQSLPFVDSAMGSYYAEAMQSGASVSQSVLYANVCGTMEGVFEAIGTEIWLGKLFGSKAVAEEIITAGRSVFKASAIAPKALLIHLVASALGNGLEEVGSYAVSIGMQKATYNKDAAWDSADAWGQFGGGVLIGLLGAGLSMGSDTQSGIVAEFLNSEAGQKWASEAGQSAVNDLMFMSVISETAPSQLRAQMQLQDNGTSTDEVSATVRNIDQISRQMEDGQKKYDSDMAKFDAELQAKKDALASIEEEMSRSSLSNKEYAKLGKRRTVALSELEVETAQVEAKRTERTKAFTEATEQHKIDRHKAQQKLLGMSISVMDAFSSDIVALGNLARNKVTTVPNEIGEMIIAKMDAARAGRLIDFMQKKNEIQQGIQYESVKFPNAATTSAETAGEAQTPTGDNVVMFGQNSAEATPVSPVVSAEQTAQPSNVVMFDQAQNPAEPMGAEATVSNKVGTDAKPSSETMGIVDPRLQEGVSAFRKFGRAAYKRVVSGAAGTERASRVQKKLGIGGASIDSSAQGIRNAQGTAQYILGDSLVDINGTRIGRSLTELFKDIPQEKWADFQKYLLAKHTESRMTLEQRGYGKDKPVLASESGALDPDGNATAMDANEAAAIVAKLEADNPNFKAVRDSYRSWWSGFMRSWAVDGGLMTETQFNALEAKYPDYVPTYRVDKNSVGGASSATRNSVTVSSAIRNATGSTDEIQDIRISLSDMVKRYVTMERRNELVQNLYSFAEMHTKAAAEFATIFDEESGFSPDVDFVSFDELANKDAAEVKNGQYIIRGFRDGERVSMHVSKDVYDAINYLTNPTDVSVRSQHENEILRGARTISKPIKGVITGYNPFFALMNFARDAQTYFVNTNAKAGDIFINIGRAVSERAKNSALWQSYLALGGNASGYITSQQMTDANVTGKGKVSNAVKKAGEIVGWLGGYTENMFRFAEYINGVSKYGDTADGRRNAMADAADVTVNFSRSGAYTKAADAFCLYLNANVQGLDKMARTIANNPGRTALRGLSLAAIALLLRYVTGNDDNPHYQNLTNYVKDSSYCIPNVLGERDDNGYCTTFIKIPKSREYGTLIVATLERAARWADGSESFDDAFADLGKDIGTSIGIRMEPFWTAAQATTTNKNYFGSDIVPMYMQNEAAPDQTTAQTSIISDAISERLYDMGVEVSPMVMDYIIDQYGGFYGQMLTSVTAKDSSGVLGVAENIVADKFVADPLYQSGAVGRFYDAMDDAQYFARQSQREREKLGISTASADEQYYDALGDYQKQLAALRKEERAILSKEDDTPERKDKIDKIREQMNEVANAGLALWAKRGK